MLQITRRKRCICQIYRQFVNFRAISLWTNALLAEMELCASRSLWRKKKVCWDTCVEQHRITCEANSKPSLCSVARASNNRKMSRNMTLADHDPLVLFHICYTSQIEPNWNLLKADLAQRPKNSYHPQFDTKLSTELVHPGRGRRTKDEIFGLKVAWSKTVLV